MSSRRAVAFGLGLVLVGCGPKLVRETIYQSEDSQVRVDRVHREQGGQPVPQGYAHPVMIADVRLAHILASISHKDDKGKTRPTIRSEHVYTLAEGLAKALQTAGPDEEIVAAAFSSERRFGLFKSERVTSFQLFFREPQLVIEFYAIDEPFEVRDRRGETVEYEIPTGSPKGKKGFRLEAGKAQAVEGPRKLAIDWRDPFFARPMSLSVRFGKVRRRTILMEADPEEIESPAVTPRSEGFSDAQTRALDQLDATRRAGLITESEFLRRRRLIIENRLEEAGYGSASP